MRILTNRSGFTLPEVLVGIFLLSIVGLAVASYSNEVLRRAGQEAKLATAAMELRNGLSLMSSELRASASISPYLVGSDPSLVTCNSALAVTSTTVKFMKVEDDAGSTSSGLKAYYVGYKYDSATGELLRGEIAATTVTSCIVPSGDPTSSTVAKTIANNLTQIDEDGNSVLDSVFSISGNILTVRLGVSLNSSGSTTVSHMPRTRIFLRTHS